MVAKILAMAAAVMLSLVAATTSPQDARAEAQGTITSEPLRAMTIRVAPGEAAAVLEEIAQRARAERYAVRTDGGPDGPSLAIYHLTIAVHVFATAADPDRLALFAYDGTISAHALTLRRWDEIMADLCRSARIVGCVTMVARASPGTREQPAYRSPLFLDIRVWTKVGGADALADAVAAYGMAHGFAVRDDRDEGDGPLETVTMVDDRLYVRATVFRRAWEQTFFLTVTHGASMPGKAEVATLVDGLRAVVRGMGDLDMIVSEAGPDDWRWAAGP